MLRNNLAIGVIAAGISIIIGRSAWAGGDIDAGALAKALSEASIPLDQGLKASEREGQPISGKYELEDGALQLSVYAMKGDKFTEVIVDHKAGSIKKAEPITDADDLVGPGLGPPDGKIIRRPRFNETKEGLQSRAIGPPKFSSVQLSKCVKPGGTAPPRS